MSLEKQFRSYECYLTGYENVIWRNVLTLPALIFNSNPAVPFLNVNFTVVFLYFNRWWLILDALSFQNYLYPYFNAGLANGNNKLWNWKLIVWHKLKLKCPQLTSNIVALNVIFQPALKVSICWLRRVPSCFCHSFNVTPSFSFSLNLEDSFCHPKPLMCSILYHVRVSVLWISHLSTSEELDEINTIEEPDQLLIS